VSHVTHMNAQLETANVNESHHKRKWGTWRPDVTHLRLPFRAAHSYVWHDSFICVTWLFTYASWLQHTTWLKKRDPSPGQESSPPEVIFRKRALWLVALLQNDFCIWRDSVHMNHTNECAARKTWLFENV